MSDSVLLKEELFTQIFTANSGEIKQIILFFIDVRLYQMIYKKQVIFQKRKTKKKKTYPTIALCIFLETVKPYTENL